MIVNINVGNNHTMEIPGGMHKLLEDFFSAFEFEGELNFLLAKKLKGRCSLVGSLRLVSINNTTRTLTINAQPGGNNTRHELTCIIPHSINVSNFENQIQETIYIKEKPHKKQIKEKNIFLKCYILFYTLNEKFRSGINKRSISKNDFLILKYKDYVSLYTALLNPAVEFKFLTPEGQKGDTTYVWTPHFLAKKDEYEKNHPSEPPKKNIDEQEVEKQTLDDGVVKTENKLTSMSEEELIALFSESDDRIKTIDLHLAKLRQERTQLTSLIPKILAIIDGIKIEKTNKIKEAIQSILPLTNNLSDEDLLKIFGR